MNESFKKLIQELVEEELTETSSTSNVAPYNTPFAFRGNSAAGKAKQKKNATQAGYEVVTGREDTADDRGTQEVETVPYGDGKIKKPVNENKEDRIRDLKEKCQKLIAEKNTPPVPSSARKLEIDKQLASMRSEIEKLQRSKNESISGQEYFSDRLSQVDKMLSDLQKKPQKTAADRARESNLRNRKSELQKKKQDAHVSYKSEQISEGYADFKAGDGTPRQKIGMAIREINKQINEINRMVKMSSRLKRESNLDSGAMWKSTMTSLNMLESKMNVLASRIRELKS
jgi:hypothetical protein